MTDQTTSNQTSKGKPAKESRQRKAKKMSDSQATENVVRLFLRLIAERYDIEGAILYGSRARGTHRQDSDADVAVLLRGEHQRFLTTKLDMADIAFDVMLETGVLVSPLPICFDEWEHPESYSNPALLHNINREGVRL